MNGKPTTYIINFFAEGVNVWTLTRYLHDSRDIIAYWNYIPLVYCVKSPLLATELAAKLQPYFPLGRFMIVEINAKNMNGMLPEEAWTWFYMDHHVKQELPYPFLEWTGSLLGGLGGFARLPSPPKKD
jgi:hypothetical protein